MITTTAPTIDANGITAPTYAEVLDFLKTKYRSIYGEDTYLESDSKDGQLLGVFASSINDSNAVAIAIYRSFSPSSAQGDALASNVKINGIKKNSASFSTADLLIEGQAGTTINNGSARDQNGNMWALPSSVTIPPGGTITVTATCAVLGAIAAAAGTIIVINTPTRGWQNVTNPADAVEGAAIESDAALRARQKISTAIPSLTVFDGIVGAVAGVSGVSRYRGYENDTNATDANGIPAHSIALVVEGGDAVAIAQAIAAKKPPGTGTYGTTAEVVTDVYGRPITIRLFRPTDGPITAVLTIKALTGYTSVIGVAAQQAIVDYINGTGIGGGGAGCVEWDMCISAAKSITGADTFKIVSLALSGPHGAGTPDATLLFNEAASASLASITLAVT
ncbi:baseplate J/gp47 family protein [Herbaspirillum robiniae]|uniref:baseplate J/gp47 family protein n=1 Tax=Herbaspirillum robiniae TaxID=2014887 RepID=UPI0009A1DF81|nr:baseplate J/gp47 family protein [Herbaspirillum robiniae]